MTLSITTVAMGGACRPLANLHPAKERASKGCARLVMSNPRLDWRKHLSGQKMRYRSGSSYASYIASVYNTYYHLTPTQLGHAALASAFPPDAALFVFSDLFQASKAIALDTELHMLYLVTPINCSVWQDCNWNHLHSLFVMLDFNAKRVAKMVSNIGKLDDMAYNCFKGELDYFELPMVVSFCSRLGWVYLRDLLSGFATRLAFGVRKELSELVLIQGIDASR
uniref:Reverse transcriptase domain-containing protein n=1 Tax=Heterorhabditis bacteriophora TaxID=37862 RepID=A0A1I7WUV2_HETBA